MTTSLRIGRCIIAEKAARPRSHFSRQIARQTEVETVIRARHGGTIPDPAGTDDLESSLAYVQAVALAGTDQPLFAWCARFAPWVAPDDLAAIEASRRGRVAMLSADEVADLLGVTMVERTRLGLRTIGACDVPKADRKRVAKERKREKDRQRAAQRRAANSISRADYLAREAAKEKPWVAAGVSRRTWYRRRANDVARGPSRVGTYITGDEPRANEASDIIAGPLVEVAPHPDRREEAGPSRHQARDELDPASLASLLRTGSISGPSDVSGLRLREHSDVSRDRFSHRTEEESEPLSVRISA